MSTFNGFVSEFPQIRIDYFRTLPDRPPPLACFLSHIHSDHLLGLDSLKSPFVYCSPATREVLLRLEKYPHRMNFIKGIVEVTKQTYRHLRKLLKPLPLDTPTSIELSPRNNIQVTLLDANHCLGAVMFLIESSSDAILYTGDIRSEPWWVNNLTRHPKLVQYVHLPDHHVVRRLSKIYLDTTFAIKERPYRTFPPKAEGIAELLRAVAEYPSTTQFYMHAWTFGYEDVWIALSQALNSPIHLDRYRYETYTSVRRSQGPGLEAREAPALCGFMVGNVHHPGILTRDPSARLHSCEKASGCPMLVGPQAAQVVHIKPIISRHGGHEIAEIGLGGGKGDLDQIHELHLGDAGALPQLKAMCASKIRDENLREKVIKMLERKVSDGDSRLTLDEKDDADMPIHQIIEMIIRLTQHARQKHATEKQNVPTTPELVTFPYSRHSSYEELRHLLSAFRPKDVFPCTAPTALEYNEDRSMQALFGDVCRTEAEVIDKHEFSWDVAMRLAVAELETTKKRTFTQLDGAGDERAADTQPEEVAEVDPSSSQEQYHSAADGRECVDSLRRMTVSKSKNVTFIEHYSDRLVARERAKRAAVDGIWGDRIKLQCIAPRWMDEEI